MVRNRGHLGYHGGWLGVEVGYSNVILLKV